ncbi:glycosyltransferase [Pseudanabaena sp. PCC 6802]|uniref:glycosyltransferase n=1 Tax=Pseudanabaena sp. PCC 6802 TaxID=118173 RepID=UPI00034CE7D7|nr:glycosyltransferase [Pseudanabaena sp. PCC 6802]
MRYIEIAKVTLVQGGWVALLKKIRDKILHVLFFGPIDAIKRGAIRSPLPRPKPIALATAPNPVVSFLIYIDCNHVHAYNCLLSIQKYVEPRLPIEIIIINDAQSSDKKLARFLSQVSGVQIVRLTTDRGAIEGFNLAASKAQGKWLCFLDRDCQIGDRWAQNLKAIVREIDRPIDRGIGAIGSKLTFAGGDLHNAGGVIWQDGSVWPYGQFEFAGEPEYSYVRLVDFCPAIGTLVDAQLFRSLQGFSRSYDSLLYASADLGLALQSRDCKVLYQAKSEIIYHQSPKDAAKDRNPNSTDAAKLEHRWHGQLQERYFTDRTEHREAACRRLLPKPTILIVDTLVPAYDKESGSYRLFNIIKILQQLGYHIIFLPDYGHEQEPYTSEFESMGIEVLYFTHRQADWKLRLERRLSAIDLAWVCRPELCAKYFPVLQKQPNIKLIYDTIDLHFLRLKRGWEISSQKTREDEEEWREMQISEVQAAQAADLTIVVTAVEQKILESLDVRNVQVIPNIHHIYEHPIPKFSDRHDILFIGGYYHIPNIDAVTWLCQEIMPLVWAKHPEIKLTLLGSNPSPQVKALKNDRVSVPGYIKDVEPYFLNHRIFVAPLRYGAGMKGKIGHSLSYGLPTVTTSIGAEGMGLNSGFDALIADSADTFAESILQLYTDESLWRKISNNAIAAVRHYSPEAVKAKISNLFMSLF